jgi:stress response protein YsnF
VSEDVPFNESKDQTIRRFARERDEAADKVHRLRSMVTRLREENLLMHRSAVETHNVAVAAALNVIDKTVGIPTTVLMELREKIGALKVGE